VNNYKRFELYGDEMKILIEIVARYLLEMLDAQDIDHGNTIELDVPDYGRITFTARDF